MKILIYLLGILAFCLTILPFSRSGLWWIRLGEFLRVQIGVLSVSVILLVLIFARPLNYYRIALISVLSLCALYQLISILPFIPLYPIQVEASTVTSPKRTIKLLISNVLIDNRDPAKLLNLIDKEDPDVILLAEPDQRWIRDVEPLDEKYPYAVKKPLDNAYGMALFSRLKLSNTQIKYLVEDDIPSIHSDITLPSGEVIRFYGVHPRPPVPGEATTSITRDAELVMVGKMVKNTKIPTIIAGDLNDVAWSQTTTLFQKVSGMLDPRIGRGLYSSFHADYPFLRFPLDHVFHSSHFRLVELQRLPDIGSDHFPLLIVLTIENDAQISHDEPEANVNDLKQAEQTIEDAEDKLNRDLPEGDSQSNNRPKNN